MAEAGVLVDDRPRAPMEPDELVALGSSGRGAAQLGLWRTKWGLDVRVMGQWLW